MADTVNIYNRHVYQQKMQKSNIRNSRNLKITVIFWSHLVFMDNHIEYLIISNKIKIKWSCPSILYNIEDCI